MEQHVITNLNEFILFRNRVNAGEDFHDIHVIQLCSFEVPDNWIPIGTSEHPFRGIYSGQNERIKNVRSQSEGLAGLFGYLENATVENVIIEQGWLSGTEVGGICISMKDSIVQNCLCSASLTAKGPQGFAGGIVGHNVGGTIRGCTFEGTIESSSVYGGICGKNYGTISECTLKGNIPGIGEGNSGDIHIVYEEDIVCYKGTKAEDQCTIRANRHDTLKAIREKLENINFIHSDDKSKRIGYRFLMMSAADKSTTFSDIIIGVGTEEFINYSVACHPTGHHLILTNIYKEEQFDLVGFPVKNWEDRHLQIRCTLNTKDMEAKKENEGLFEPIMLHDVLVVESTQSYEKLKNVCICCEGSAIEFELRSWGAVGFNYDIVLSDNTKIIDGLSQCYGDRADRYATSHVRRWQKEKKLIQIVGKKNPQLTGNKEVKFEKIIFKSRTLYQYTKNGITYKSSTLPPDLCTDNSGKLKVATMSLLSADNMVVDIPGETVESGTAIQGNDSEQNWGSGIYNLKVDSWEKKLGEVSVYFLVFKTLEEAQKVICILNGMYK